MTTAGLASLEEFDKSDSTSCDRIMDEFSRYVGVTENSHPIDAAKISSSAQHHVIVNLAKSAGTGASVVAENDS
jgi:hypothetical protein